MEPVANDCSRLFGLLMNGKSEHEGIKDQYLTKLSGISMTHEETNLFCDALSGEYASGIRRTFMNAVWDMDRNRMHVMLKSFPYCVQIMSHKITIDRNAEKTLDEMYKKIVTQAWTKAGITEKMPDADYQRISSQLNAEYLMRTLYLTMDERLFSDLDVHEQVRVPLMQNEAMVQKHLTAVLNTWQAIRASHSSSSFITIDSLLDITVLLEECPDAEERMLAFVTERGYYDGGAVREYLSVAPALGSGAI